MSATMMKPVSEEVEAQQHSEGTVAKAIEQQTAKLPSDVFLWAAGGSIAVSAVLQLLGKQKASYFWVNGSRLSCFSAFITRL